MRAHMPIRAYYKRGRVSVRYGLALVWCWFSLVLIATPTSEYSMVC